VCSVKYLALAGSCSQLPPGRVLRLFSREFSEEFEMLFESVLVFSRDCEFEFFVSNGEKAIIGRDRKGSEGIGRDANRRFS